MAPTPVPLPLSLPCLSRRTRAATLVIVALVAACVEPTRPVIGIVPLATPPIPPANGVAVYLSLSNANPRAGDQVVVTAQALRGSAAAPIGSFFVKVSYNDKRLRLVNQTGSDDGVVALNPVDGAILAAGASTKGFESGKLFAFTLDVQDPSALASLVADVKEIVSLKFTDHRSTMVIERNLVNGATIKP